MEKWRKHYNEKRPHSSLGYPPPAPATIGEIQPRESIAAMQQSLIRLGSKTRSGQGYGFSTINDGGALASAQAALGAMGR